MHIPLWEVGAQPPLRHMDEPPAGQVPLVHPLSSGWSLSISSIPELENALPTLLEVEGTPGLTGLHVLRTQVALPSHTKPLC